MCHVMHDDPRPENTVRRDLPSGQPMLCAAPIDSEAVFWKAGWSGFADTELVEHLHKTHIARLVIGADVAAFCVNSTARSAANLGFDVQIPEDALIAFARPARHGGDIDAEVALEVTLLALHAGFGQGVPTQDVLDQLAALS